MSPTTTSLQRLMSEYTQESLGEQQIPDDFDYDDVTIGQTLLHACRRRADHSEEEGLSSCLSSSVSHDRAVKPVVCRLMSSTQETQRHNSENKQIRIQLDRQREQILADCQAEIRKHEFQADYGRRRIQKSNETIESQKEEICRAHQRRRTTPTRSTTSSWTIEEAKLGSPWSSWEVSMKWKNWSDFKNQESMDFQWENWPKIETLSLNSQARFRNCKMKLTAWMIREIFKMLNQYAVENPTLPVNLCFSPPHPVLGGMLSRSFGMPSRHNEPPSIWDTQSISRNVFAIPTASSSAPYPQGSNPWISYISEHTSPHVMSESQTPVQDQRCQSRPSAKSSVIPSEGDFSKELWCRPTTTADFRSSFWQIPHVSNVRLLEDKIQHWTEALLWIKEVEMVESVDDLKSSCSVRRIQMPKFEVLDAKIASALNRIIHNSQFKRKVSLEEQKAQKMDRFLRGRQIAYLIYDYFRVTGANDSVENYADLFTGGLRNDDIQESDSKWDGILIGLWRKSHLMTSWKDCTN